MHLTEIIQKLNGILSVSIRGLAPELALVVTIVLLLVVRLFQGRRPGALNGLALLGTLAAALLAVLQMLNLLGVGGSAALTAQGGAVLPSAGTKDKVAQGAAGASFAAKLSRLVSTAGETALAVSAFVDESGSKWIPRLSPSSSEDSQRPAQAPGAAPAPTEKGSEPVPEVKSYEIVPLENLPPAVKGALPALIPGATLTSARKIVTTDDKVHYELGGVKSAFHEDQPMDLFASPGESRPSGTTGTLADPTGRGLLRFDGFTVFFRIFLLAFTALVIWLTTLTGIPDREDSPDFYVLLLGAALGMSLMVSSNHLLMIYIAVEMASLPSYALAGFLKGRREASEAALKYVVFGAGASGIMLYGISLLAGKYGTAHLPTLAMMIAQSNAPIGGVLLVGLFLVLAGVAFKIAAVPFHFWCPDVFEGAAAEVAGFLSVASKAAALGLLARLVSVAAINSSVFRVPGRPDVDEMLGAAVGVLAAITATYGNLAAFGQTNIKRLLAFSTIAHAGYMMMPVAAAIQAKRLGIAGASQSAIESLVFYLMIYFFMNLGAFAVVALIRNRIRSEDLRDYGGLGQRNMFLAVAMAIFMLSLLGVPPLAGFAAKFSIFAVLYQTKMYWLLVIGLANAVFSAFYYIKVIRAMFIDVPSGATTPWRETGATIAFCSLMLAFNLGAMFIWGGMDELTRLAVPNLFQPL